MEQAAKRLRIVQDGAGVAIRYADERERRLYTDGRKIQEAAPGEPQLGAAKWKSGSRLVVKSETLHGGSLKETFELSPGGDQLFVTVEMEGDGRRPPLEFKRVYDAVDDDEEVVLSDANASAS